MAWSTETEAESVIRTPLKRLAAQLDPDRFVQTQRAFAVSLRSVSHVVRHDNETASVHLKGRADLLPVSRSYLHLFGQV